MATNKVITYDPFKRGDTPSFVYNFTPPTSTFSWTDIVADAALTAVASPNDNSGAGMVRTAIALTINTDNTASVTVSPTVAESKLLKPDTTYKIELQLRDSGDTAVATAVTGTVFVEQDYVI